MVRSRGRDAERAFDDEALSRADESHGWNASLRLKSLSTARRGGHLWELGRLW